jgi:hypothetical protein
MVVLRYCKDCDEVYEVGEHFCAAMQSKAAKRQNLCVGGPVVIRFNPYVETNMTDKPIEIRSREQRNQLCRKYGVTYDTAKTLQSKREEARTAKLDSDTFETAVDMASNNKATSGDVVLHTGEDE